MAYSFTAASSQYLSTLTAPVTVMPITMACWFRVTSTTPTAILLNIGTTGSANGSNGSYRLVIPASTANLRAGQLVIGVAATGLATTAANTVIANTWMHGAAVFTTTSSRTVYLSNTASVTGTGTQSAPATNNFAIGTSLASVTSTFMTGQIAEVGVWNADLTSNEIASLASGVTCDQVRPQSLVFYAPLIRELIDVRGGSTLTNTNGATVFDHPRVYA